MSATHYTVPSPRTGGVAASARTDWGVQIRLAIVLSIVAVVVVSALAGRVADTVLVVGTIVVSSAIAWRRLDSTHARR